MRPSPLMSPAPSPVIVLGGSRQALGGNRQQRPRLIRVWPGEGEDHVPLGAIGVLGIGRVAADEGLRPHIRRRLTKTGFSSVGHLDRHVPLPRPARRPGVLPPPGLLARDVDGDQVHAPVAVDVHGRTDEDVAIALGIEGLGLLGDGVNLPVGGGVVDASDGDVRLAVAVEVGHGDPFGAERPVDLHLAERDPRSGPPCGDLLARGSAISRRTQSRDRQARQCQAQAANVAFHSGRPRG